MNDSLAVDGGDWVDRAKSAQFRVSPPVPADEEGVVIVAAPERALAADICLQIGIGTAEQPVCLVATDVAPPKIVSYLSDRAPTRPATGFVDATSHRPTPEMKKDLQALEDVPGAQDLLQLTVAIDDVCKAIAPANRSANILIPVFDSLLGVAPTSRVVRVLAHIAESTEDDGRVVIGLNYTAGSSETMQTLKKHSDTVVWAEPGTEGTVTLDIESTRN